MTHHFEVSGPRRDWDCTTFCEEHVDEALTCAQEWIAELWDALEIGESGSVKIRVLAGKADRCYECEPMKSEEMP